MVEMSRAAGTLQGQLRLIGVLRWRLFVNSLRTWRGRGELAGRVVVGAIVGAGVVGLGFLLAFASWTASREKSALILTAVLWAVFAVWQLLPIFATGFGAQGDWGLLLRFPLRYSAFVALTLAYGLLDPISVAGIYWLFMILVGITLARPAVLPWALSALVVFAGVNVLLNRAIFTWLERWLAKRRTREIMGIAFFAVMIGSQFCGPVTEHWGKQGIPALMGIALAQRFLPPGLAAYAIESGFSGGGTQAALALSGLLAFAVVFGWFLDIRLRAQYHGERSSETSSEQANGRTQTYRGWRVAGIPPRLTALVEKDFRYLLRNTSQYLNLVIPLLLVLIFSMNRRTQHPLFSGSAFFPISVGYCALVLVSFVYNSLGYDGAGVSMLLAAPLPFRDVLLAKNVLHSLITSIEILVVSVLVSLVAGPPPFWTVAITLAGALFVILLNLAAGNLVSLYFPKRLQFGTVRRQNVSGIAALLTVLIPGIAIGIAIGAYQFCRGMLHPRWSAVVLLLLTGIAFLIYRRVLAACSEVATNQKEVLVAELCRGQ